MSWIVAIVIAVHLAGGPRTYRRHRRAGLNPRLYYSLGRGWYESVDPGARRVPHQPPSLNRSRKGRPAWSVRRVAGCSTARHLLRIGHKL
jgi:hypothetical protein